VIAVRGAVEMNNNNNIMVTCLRKIYSVSEEFLERKGT
jgi:hypothetical protein